MEIDYEKMTAKMHEIVAREGPPVDAEARGKLWDAAAKELKAEGGEAPKSMKDYIGPIRLSDKAQKCADCPGDGKKCGACLPDPPYVSLGGAISFAEADAFDEAENIEFHVREQERLFRRITENIFGSDDMTLPEKLAKVKAAATELEGRLEKPPEEKGLLDRLKAKVGLGAKVAQVNDKTTATSATGAPGALHVFKDAKGDWRWMTLTTNIFRDRDGEILPGAAHEDSVAYTDRTKDMPDLRLWHVPGSRAGVADWLDFAHGFVLHSGTFDKGMEDVAKSLAETEEPLGVSHGFYYDKEEGSDIYRSYRDFEVSVLPLDKAANQWTEFTADNVKEVAMGLNDKKREFLVEHMGEDRVAALEKGLEAKEAELKAGKVDFKEVLAEAIEATPEGDGKPAEGDKGGEPDGVTAQIAALTELVKAQGTQLTEIATAQGTQAEDIKGLKATDDEKIAAKMEPARQPPADGERPSEGKDNVLSVEDAKKKGAEEVIDPDKLPDTPGGRALKQIGASRGGS